MRTLLPLLATLALACGHATKVRPAAKGHLELEETLGGPFASIQGAPVPTPLVTLGASYGVAERADVSAHVHPTAAAFGVAGLDLGASVLALRQHGALPALTFNTRLYGFSDFRTGSRAYLELGTAASVLLRRRVMLYAGGNAFLQGAGPVLWSVAGGGELHVGPAAVQLELRWYEPDHRTDRAVVRWINLGGRGGVGALIGWRLRFHDGKLAVQQPEPPPTGAVP